jgi:hypothetical protein
LDSVFDLLRGFLNIGFVFLLVWVGFISFIHGDHGGLIKRDHGA